MTCAEARELVEAVAEGDAAPAGFSEHVAGCPACAAALAVAVRIERALAASPAPAPPAKFSQAVRVRIRNERWRAEERVDRAFNVAIGVGVVFVVGAVVALSNLGSLAQMFLVAADAIGEAARQPSPLPSSPPSLVVGLAAGVLAILAGVWWWADRRGDYAQG